ncbi:MAG: OmpA family protein, partial [Pseudomonadota bacterium]
LAEAKFGFETVVNETVSRGDLPSGWSGHVIAGLEALAMLSRGQLEVTEAALTLTGTTPSLRVKDDLRAALAGELPSGMQIVLNLWEEQALEVTPLTQVPADLCAEQIALLLDGGQITFPPSESQIDEESLPIIDRIAEILSFCPGARFEIAGHTDSQGRESSNMTLSQSRADAVLGALLERGIDTVFLSARGYGETDPIAPNDTEAGRAQNRRISFEVAVEGGDVAPDEDASTPEAQLLEGEASSPAEEETQALAVSTESDAEPIEEPVDTAPEAPEALAQDTPPAEVEADETVVTRSSQSPLEGIIPDDAPTAADETAEVERGPLPQIGVEPEGDDIIRPQPRPTDLAE